MTRIADLVSARPSAEVPRPAALIASKERSASSGVAGRSEGSMPMSRPTTFQKYT